MTLTNPTNAELNAAFAEKVCGYTYRSGAWCLGNGVISIGIEPLDFCSDANAVLPWLEKWHCEIGNQLTMGAWLILVRKAANSGEYWRAHESSMPRAAVIALLRAHGVEVTT